MAKFCGKIGYVTTVDPGDDNDVWRSETVERTHYGDILRDTRRYEKGESINDNVTLNKQISILSDDYSDSHYGDIRYAVLNGVKWKVTSVEPLRPRIILTLGGVYNG